MDEDDVCRQCNSTDFHEEDGWIVCANGHQQERGPVTGEDEGDFARQGKIVRKKEKREKVKISKGQWHMICPAVDLR